MEFGSDDKDHTLRGVPHPRFWDGGRQGFLAFTMVCLIGLLIFGTNEITWIATYGKIALTFLVAVPVSFWFGQLSIRARARKRAEQEIAYRAARNEEAEMKIAEMQQKNSRIPIVTR